MTAYRVGNHQPQNLYRDGAYIGVMFTAEDAALVVEAMNSHGLANATGAELLAELRSRGELDDKEDGPYVIARIDALRNDLDAYTLKARRADYGP